MGVGDDRRPTMIDVPVFWTDEILQSGNPTKMGPANPSLSAE